MYRIFIVEDDAAIAQAVCEQAESWALEARCVSDFRRVAEEAAAYGPHLILLDISLPFFDGYHWCRQIRRTSRVPIIFLSSAADNMNIVMAMNMGADDFIAKPFDRNVLMAKVQALLRRTYDIAVQPPVPVCRLRSVRRSPYVRLSRIVSKSLYPSDVYSGRTARDRRANRVGFGD